MEFRPCIDIHNGQVKQIVGGSLTDQNDQAKENFVALQCVPTTMIASSVKREITVAIAAPLTPSTGAPNFPKIKM